jgi:hypothetical protein
MEARIPWASRTFRYGFPWENYPEQIERVRGTPVRAAALVDGMAQETLAQRVGDGWSIQENIAHLTDLDEELFIPRIGQYQRGESVMIPSDITNPRTNGAGHNRRTMGEVMASLSRVRASLVELLETLAPEVFSRTALHPRLKLPMRLVDLVCFVAEHDDYHLARVSELKRRFGSKRS